MIVGIRVLIISSCALHTKHKSRITHLDTIILTPEALIERIGDESSVACNFTDHVNVI